MTSSGTRSKRSLGRWEFSRRLPATRGPGPPAHRVRRQRFDADLRHGRELTDRFLVACATGDLSSLLDMLSEDVVVWTDGGGKARAAVRPVVGPAWSSRFLMNVAKRVHGLPRAAVLNGQPSSVFVDGGAVVAALVLDIMEGKIVGVRVVTNPDKLERLGPDSGTPRLPKERPRSLQLRLRILPAAVRGRSSTITSSLGAAQGAMVSATTCRNSSSGRVVARHDPGDDALTPFGVGTFPHRHLGDAGMCDEGPLDEVGPDHLRPGRDDVVDPAGDDQPSIGIEVAGVPGGEPVGRAVGSGHPSVLPTAVSSGRAWARAPGSRRPRRHRERSWHSRGA